MVGLSSPFPGCDLLARNDSATTFENRKVFINLLRNDSVSAGPAKIVKLGGGVAKVGDVIAQKKTPYGLLKLKLSADGTVVFEPSKALEALKAGQIYKTSFVYTIVDALGQTSSAVVKLNIKGLNSGPTISSLGTSSTGPTPVLELEDAHAQNIAPITGVIRVTDLDRGNVLTAKIVGGPVLAYTGGAVPAGFDVSALTAGGALKFGSAVSNGGTRAITWSYDPAAANLDFLAAGQTLTVTYQFRVTDGTAKSPLRTLTFTVVGTNDGPVAVNDSATVDGGTSVLVNVRANDSDLDNGDVFTVTGFTQGGNGSVAIENGQLHYSPKAGFSGTDTFEYTITDKSGAVSTATVTVNVLDANAPPVAQYVSATGVEDTPSIPLILKATDPNAGDKVDTFEIADLPANGTLYLDAAMTIPVTADTPIAAVNNELKLYFKPNADFNGTVAFDYTANDGELDSAPATATITVTPVDDAPSAFPVEAPLAPVNTQTNLTLVVDISGSMRDSSGLTGTSKLAAAKAALLELLEQYHSRGDVAVQLVAFSSGATFVGSQWLSVDAARLLIKSLESDNGATNFDAALQLVRDTYDAGGKIAGGTNVAYFLSDGDPNPDSHGLDAGEQAVWEAFLKEHDIKSYALGIGGGVQQANLEPIAYDGKAEADIAPVVVVNVGNLESVLVGTVTGSVTGNLLTGSTPQGSFGGDGPGFVQSITVDGITYTFDPAGGGGITPSGGTDRSSFDTATNVVHVETAAGGVISVDMDNGDFTYDVPADASTGLKETFGYALVDADGDSAPSTLTIDVQAVDNPPIARDDRVVTNLPGGAAVVDIPTWALLYNDSDLNGDAVTVASILSASGGSAVLAAGSVAFTDPAPAGGSFVYEAAASGGTDKGTVTVIRQSASALDGLGLNDILIDGDGDGALNGNSGNDVLIGNGGNDVLIGSVGRDLMEGGAGADAFKYTFLTHSTASAFDTIRDFTTGSDRIDLADLDANAGAAGDQAFTFVAAQSQAVIANSVTWYQQDGNTFVQADVNGDATADFVLRLLGNKALTAGDFTL